MFKVTWATLCGVHASGVRASTWPRGRFRKYARMDVFGCMRVCKFRAYAWTFRTDACVRTRACVDAYTTARSRLLRADAYTVRVGRARAWMRTLRRGRDARMRGCVHYYAVETFARGRVYGLVATHVRIAHGLNFMDDCVIWPNYTDNRMQPKAKAMQLKVKGMHLKMEACN